MRGRSWYWAVAALLAIAAASGACGGGGDDDGDADPTSAATRSGTRTGTPARTGTASASGAETVDPEATGTAAPLPTTSGGAQPGGPPPGGPPPSGGAAFTDAQARILLDAALLKPADLGIGNWSIQTDTSTDNAAAAAANPEQAASNERCGRLLGRTIVNQPEDLVGRFIGGQAVSFFSTATVYATEAGAADCAAENAVRLANCVELAKSFGTVFIDPAAVVCAPVQYPQYADGSFAGTLTGQINAGGTIVDITIFVVAFRSGNTTGAVGSAAAPPGTPPNDLQPLVQLVVGRIEANQ